MVAERWLTVAERRIVEAGQWLAVAVRLLTVAERRILRVLLLKEKSELIGR